MKRFSHRRGRARAVRLLLVGLGALIAPGFTPAAEPVAMRIDSFTVAPAHTPLAVVRIRNLQAEKFEGFLQMQGPAGWQFTPAEEKLVLAPGETKRAAFTVHRGTIVRANAYLLQVTAAGSGDTVIHRQTVVCASAPNSKPQIDGQFDDWKDAIPVTFTPRGKKTAVSTLWNRRQFAMLVAVEEDKHLPWPGDGGAAPFDAVQIAISADDQPTSTSPEAPAGRREFLLVATPDGKGKCFALASPEEKLAATQALRPLGPREFSCEVVVRRQDGITFYEWALPFKAMPEIRPSEGREFCLSFLVHDPDGTGIRDWGEAAGLWPSQRNRLAWSVWPGAQWSAQPPMDNKTAWGLCSSKY